MNALVGNHNARPRRILNGKARLSVLARNATNSSSARLRRLALPVGVAALGTAGFLVSIHPILNLPRVPEGPRTLLNYAFEAAGYGLVNLLAYVGGFAAASFAAFAGAPKSNDDARA